MSQLTTGEYLVDVGDHRLQVDVIGAGPPLLVVHGGMGYGHRGFRPWLDGLADTRTVVYVDLPGNGGSDTPADYDDWHTVSRLSDALHGLRVGLGVDRWSVLGHSFGGFVVQSYAIDHPDDLDALVVSCSTSALDHLDESLRFAREVCVSDEQFESIRDALLVPKATDAEFDAVTASVRSAYFADPGLLGTDVPLPRGGSAAAFNATLRIWAGSDLLDQVPSIARVPTLVLGAARDWTFPLEVGARRTHRLIAGSTLHEFAHSGHFPYVEENAEFLRVVSGWLATASPLPAAP
ncbi:alpha/beta fold hydrolase [Nocardioides nitrophenolicus]|uniref:alpha/beta fold hydrolase n=1 Tax=Nocardioides nitrophenolicus TaxID=60489 RepID=UPI0019567557|nr:alpha/beta hydrolase [Nocardioides nitrophenolicus]MBM7517489.1 proline iminopeptidase [Nocardioides nitrophenolicus]